MRWPSGVFRKASTGRPSRTPSRIGVPSSSRCGRIAPDQISEMTESLTYSTVLNRYLLVGIAGPPTRHPGKERGVYFSLSPDLIHWSARRLLLPAATLHSYRCGQSSPIAYPSVLDPSSRSRKVCALFWSTVPSCTTAIRFMG